MKRITGIVENHRVDVGGIVNATRNGDAVDLAFTNSAVEDGGHTIVRIPFERLKVSLGIELVTWFLLSLERGLSCDGQIIESGDLIQFVVKSVTYDGGKKGKRFEMMFSDPDDETVVLSMSEESAIEILGNRLYGRTLERGELFRLYMLKQINEAHA